MKKLQCPLCGGDITIEKRVLYSDRPLLFHAGCEQCRWETNRGYAAEKDAWKDAEKYISGFPPIMRVCPGDKLVYSGSIYPVTIVSQDLDLCKITVRDYAGDSFIIYCDEVEQWPWEIEQKGGSNDI